MSNFADRIENFALSNKITLSAVSIITFLFLITIASEVLYAEKIDTVLFSTIIPTVIAGAISAMMAILPICVARVQTTLRSRQIGKLESIDNEDLKNTHYYRIAKGNIESIKPVVARADSVALDDDYRLPIIILAFVTMFLALISFLGLSMGEVYFKMLSPLLGGLHILENLSQGEVIKYQESTFTAGVFAFEGAYVYMILRLLDRVNTNDLYPISFYYYAARMVVAFLVACVIRHVAAIYSLDKPYLIALIAFVCGIAPDLFLASIAREAFALARIIGAQQEPDKAALPSNYNLLMIKGLGRNEADRLIEMGIDNSQVLSCQNPLILWTRLPFDLRLIVDWISQAQLYKYVGETGMQKMRSNGIQNASNFVEALGDADRVEEISKLLAIPLSLTKIMQSNFSSDPPVKRLMEVYAVI